MRTKEGCRGLVQKRSLPSASVLVLAAGVLLLLLPPCAALPAHRHQLRGLQEAAPAAPAAAPDNTTTTPAAAPGNTSTAPPAAPGNGSTTPAARGNGTSSGGSEKPAATKCWEIKTTELCLQFKDCFWDYRYPCDEKQARCWEYMEEAACVAKSDCYWNPRALDGDAKCKRIQRRELSKCAKCRRKE